MTARVPTSVVLEELLKDAPPDHVTIAWLMGSLRERSFGIVMLLMALVALIPGASMFIGVLLSVPGFQMILARRNPVLPRFVARRRLPTRRLARLIGRAVPLLRRIERLIRPRWHTPFEATKRVVGLVVLLLGATMLAPLPFAHVLPALVIMMISFAYLEEDGVFLCIALAAALVSLSMTAAVAWATVRASDWLAVS
jgi:hypothetical protein